MKSRASFFFFLLVTTFSAAQTYTVTDLGTLPGGNSSGAKAVNATAQVTGKLEKKNYPPKTSFAIATVR